MSTAIQTQFHIKKGDKVQVISGSQKGRTGEILNVLKKKSRAVVRIFEKDSNGNEYNMISKATRPTQDNPKGGFTRREGTIHVSNLKVIESKAVETKAKK